MKLTKSEAQTTQGEKSGRNVIFLSKPFNNSCRFDVDNDDWCTDNSSGAGAATAAAESEAKRRAKKAKMSRWAGKGTAGQPRDPPDVVEAARRLLIKARKRCVEVGKNIQKKG